MSYVMEIGVMWADLFHVRTGPHDEASSRFSWFCERA